MFVCDVIALASQQQCIIVISVKLTVTNTPVRNKYDAVFSLSASDDEMGFHKWTLSVTVAVAVVMAVSVAGGDKITYAKHQMLRLGPLKYENETNLIRQWTTDGTLSKVRTLTDIVMVGEEVTVIVAPEVVHKFKADMEKYSIAFKVTSTNFKNSLDGGITAIETKQ
ncbi:hypothetical protein LSAT2_023334 [Lamellibrachia satsuma]|nr:hypothetical protein LSAT2_023334 [Lamellibrachia satsuma]